MQDIIHLLPDTVANQIAAGEVVQRPASVVKELMENAVDAGADRIEVIVTDGGRTLIQVIDNGRGMSETDARMAFERHATSKIKSADDLFALRTMGFRGEALASIVAVSQVELTTRRADDELGTRLVFSGSTLEVQEPVNTPCGSNFKVKNLFFNIPARRKFLKSVQTEYNNIVTEFERIALINSGIQFTLKHNDSETIVLPPSSLRQRIQNLYGKKINSQLIEVEVESSLLNIKGFVGAPESSRKKGALQYFFVNGRYMRHPYFSKAVMEAYSHIVPQGEQVPFFLCFDVDPSRIDVNIHPTKTEIKFEDEQILWKIIAAAVRESLGRFNAAPGLDFDTDEMPDIPAINLDVDTPVTPPKISYNPEYNPYKSISNEYRASSNAGWEKLYDGVVSARAVNGSNDYVSSVNRQFTAETGGDAETESDNAIAVEEYKPLTQYKGQYILVPVKSGLMWVHQRRAHIRVLYERYCRQLKERRSNIQGLLFPERIDLGINESVTMECIMDELSYLGFDVSSLGGGSYSINGVPVGIDGLSPVELLREILQSAMDKTACIKEKLHEELALSMARKIAIVTGQLLTHEECDTLICELFKTDSPARTPDGQVITYIMPDTDIMHYFKK